ncbi:hypothetical protein ACP4OV_002576 [Aristida adscensionis]
MGFFHRTSRQTGKAKNLLRLALSRLAIARRPRLARKAISRSDVGQLLALGHHDRALHRVEQVIQEESMLEAFDMIELYCNRLIERAAQLDKPSECGDDIRDAVAGVMFAARWCGDLPELLHVRTILANKFGSDFAAKANAGTDIVDLMLVWKLSGNKRSMELKKKVLKEIADENNILVDLTELPEAVEQDSSINVPNHQKFNQETIHQGNNNESSDSDSAYSPPHKMRAVGLEAREDNRCHILHCDGSSDGQPKPKVTASVRTRR